MCKSVPQIEAAFTRTSTSPCPTSGTGTLSIRNPRAASIFRSAFIVAGIPESSSLRQQLINAQSQILAHAAAYFLSPQTNKGPAPQDSREFVILRASDEDARRTSTSTLPPTQQGGNFFQLDFLHRRLTSPPPPPQSPPAPSNTPPPTPTPPAHTPPTPHPESPAHSSSHPQNSAPRTRTYARKRSATNSAAL